MSEKQPLKVTVYSDYVCPFCYMGKASLDAIREQENLDVEWRAFELRPGGAMPEPQYAEMIRSRWPGTQEMARRYGIELKALRFGVDTRPAHQAYKIVQEIAPDKAERFHDALFRAHWEGQYNISEPEELGALATELGIDGAALRERLEADGALAKVLREERRAQTDGITGVPAFVFEGKYLVSGAQPAEQLAAIVEEVRKKEQGEVAEKV